MKRNSKKIKKQKGLGNTYIPNPLVSNEYTQSNIEINDNKKVISQIKPKIPPRPNITNNSKYLCTFCKNTFNRDLTENEKKLPNAEKLQEQIENNYFKVKQTRAKMCPDMCMIHGNKLTLRSELNISELKTEDTLKGIFETIVRNFEIQTKAMGTYSFKYLDSQLEQRKNNLTFNEYKKLQNIKNDLYNSYGNFISEVLNKGYYTDLISGEKVYLDKPSKWAEAIIQLQYRISNISNTLITQISYYLEDKDNNKKTLCDKSPVSQCLSPCSLVKTSFGSKCKFNKDTIVPIK